MRDALAFVALLPVLAVMDLAFWFCDPERRLARSAVLTGIVVGWCAAGAAW
ncbi:hypothetical protein P7D22_21850 [Lichenihabitans sp. Uapishka_5]|uniref:hypothetical protein n=1 Tax=Lichenihabitans sp. Uapishka_5 TaxID=3037302 RepID=UPI0029E7E90E|nr:hypothetical protein [Lichenihabitans sp. Uapishka_5]MDX7953812.1 hypothetical protein [Lichenihabitans sp. Uapishka_5]